MQPNIEPHSWLVVVVHSVDSANHPARVAAGLAIDVENQCLKTLTQMNMGQNHVPERMKGQDLVRDLTHMQLEQPLEAVQTEVTSTAEDPTPKGGPQLALTDKPARTRRHLAL